MNEKAHLYPPSFGARAEYNTNKAKGGLDAGYRDGPKHKTSETSETNVRNKKYPKYHTKNGDGPKHLTSETSETNARRKCKRP